MVYSYFYSGIRGFPPPACAGSPQPRDLFAAGLARESAAGVLRAAYTCGEAASWGRASNAARATATWCALICACREPVARAPLGGLVGGGGTASCAVTEIGGG